MSNYSFTTSGYIEVYFNDLLVSRHRIETEALESLLSHSTSNNVSGTYSIKRPVTKVTFVASTPVVQQGTISSDSFFDIEGLGTN